MVNRLVVGVEGNAYFCYLGEGRGKRLLSFVAAVVNGALRRRFSNIVVKPRRRRRSTRLTWLVVRFQGFSRMSPTG